MRLERGGSALRAKRDDPGRINDSFALMETASSRERKNSQMSHRGETPMRTLRGMFIRAVALACVLAGSNAVAQNGQVPIYSANANQQAVSQFNPQPLFVSQAQQAMMSSPYGSPYGAMPASYGYGGPQGGMSGGPMMSEEYPSDGYDMGGEGGGCPYCGGGGCEYCGGGFGRHHGVLSGFLHGLLPYGEGGACAPRWYDIAVDGLYWTRDEVSEFVPFTAFTRLGPTIMSSDSLDYDYEPGMRFASRIQIHPGISLDFNYFGLFSWSANTSVSDPTNELFSPYSQFGALVGVGLPFDESDQAQFHSLRVSSTIDNFELGVRKYWTGPNCRLQGSYQSGVRYIYLVDDLNFFTLGRNVPVGLGTAPAGQSNTDVRAHNSLIGWQATFDVWANIVPGVSVGMEGKGGVYGNQAKYNTSVTGSTTAGGTSADLFETNRNSDVAVVGEANLIFIYRVGPNVTLRAGYSALFIDGVALATENFNPNNPFNTVRTVLPVNTDGNVFYHGGFAGFEWMW